MKKIAIKAVRLIPQIVLNAVIIFLLAIMVYPLLMALWNALKLNYLFESTKWYPTFPLVVSNLTDSFLQLWEYILNTLIVALFGGGGLMFITSISAYTFSKMRFPGRKLLYSMTIALMMMPGVLTIIPQVAIYNKLGLVGTDNLFALILPLWTNGTIFGIFLLTAFFSGIPNDMFEAARIDGAGEFKCYYAIALPMCLPILFTLAIMTLVNIWNDYLWPMTIDNYLDNTNVSKLENTDVIIDCSGNNEVLEILSNYQFSDKKEIYVGAFNYGATRFGYYKIKTERFNCDIYNSKTLEFYNAETIDESNLIMEGIGCYHPIFPATYSDVSIWASIFVKEIISTLNKDVKEKLKFFELEDGAVKILKDEEVQI